MKEKQIINISNCEENIQKKFYQSVDKLGEKIFFLISSLNYRIILANKYSDVFLDKHLIKSFDETKIYKENYKKENIDKIFRGICSDTIKAICVFTNNVNINNIDFAIFNKTFEGLNANCKLLSRLKRLG